MTSKEKKIPEVTLDPLRFATANVGSSQTESQENPASYHPISGAPRPTAEARMASDKPGHELSRDATIWEIYLEEANEYDQELVKARHTSLDLLLLFAALFSAILTAFLIESKNLLQQDSADASLGLLLLMAQTQQRMELGLNPPDSALIPIRLPEFSPTWSARWINGLWFTSLGFSLSAAMIAMLAKEWLTSFLASRPRPTHDHVLLRQARLEGLDRWWALHIIALLPSLLHASLLLFSIGLVVYLATFDLAIAIVLAIIVSITVLFYLGSAVLGAIYDFCPFVTEISGYVRKAIVALFGTPNVSEEDTPRHPTIKDLQALIWLSENARDPAAVDCSYQAFAGLYGTNRIRSDSSKTANLAAEESNGWLYMIPTNLTEHQNMGTILNKITSRFSRLTGDSYDLSQTPEGSLTRYIYAILALSARINSSCTTGIAEKSLFSRNKGTNNSNVDGGDEYAAQKMELMSPFDLLYGIKSFYETNPSPLSANAHANILTAELEVIQKAISALVNSNNTQTNQTRASESLSAPVIPTHKGQDQDHIINMKTNHRPSLRVGNLADLRNHAAQWLAYVVTILHLHGEGKISISGTPLQDLLRGLTIAASHEVFHRVGSDHQHAGGSVAPRFKVPHNWDANHILKANDLCAGPLGSLVSILRLKTATAGLQLRTEICAAAVEAYACWAPIVLAGVLGHDFDKLKQEFDPSQWSGVSTSDMIGVRYVAVRLALVTCRLLVPEPDDFEFYGELMELVYEFRTEDQELNTPKSKWDSFQAIAEHSGNLEPIIRFAGQSQENIERLSDAITSEIMILSVLQTTEKDITAVGSTFTPRCFAPLLRMIGSYDTQETSQAADIMDAIVQRICRSDEVPKSDQLNKVAWSESLGLEYLHQFTRSEEGFSAFLAVASNKKFVHEIAVGVGKIVHLAAGNDDRLLVEPVELCEDAIPILLDLSSEIISHIQKSPKNPVDKALLPKISTDLLDLFEAGLKKATLPSKYRDHLFWKQVETAWEMLPNGEKLNTLRERLKEIGSLMKAPKKSNAAKRRK